VFAYSVERDLQRTLL